jgi:hypothetical protein
MGSVVDWVCTSRSRRLARPPPHGVFHFSVEVLRKGDALRAEGGGFAPSACFITNDPPEDAVVVEEVLVA